MPAIVEPSSSNSAPAKKAVQPAASAHLIGPVADFLLLGGASILALAAVTLLWPKGSDTGTLAATMLLIANVINHPHFAHSYQLFYRDFRDRAFGDRFPPDLRRRYLFAAIGVPILLSAFFAYCILTSDPALMGWAANLMFFLVGWHYVKQGYGMLLVDAVLKRNFFDQRGKQYLLWNAYSVWILSWILLNRAFSKGEYWGLEYLTFAVPDAVLYIAMTVTTTTSLLAGKVLIGTFRNGKSPLLNGVVAYAVSLYLWLLAAHPAMLLIIPAFHSLQYLVVVWRYRMNMEKENSSAGHGLFQGRGPWPGFLLFVFVGCVLGYLCFWRTPFILDAHFGYDKQIFGGTLFLFIFWIFINVHHYFLDNVMWRKDNPDTRRYLFGAN